MLKISREITGLVKLVLVTDSQRVGSFCPKENCDKRGRDRLASSVCNTYRN